MENTAGTVLTSRVCTGKNSAYDCNYWLCTSWRTSLSGETQDLKSTNGNLIEVNAEDDNKAKIKHKMAHAWQDSKVVEQGLKLILDHRLKKGQSVRYC